MKSADEKYINALYDDSLEYFVEVDLLRRKKSDQSLDSAINIKKYLLSINTLSWQLDTRELNEWKVSNVSIEVDNTDNIWDRYYTSSIWYDSGMFTYVPYNSEVKIKVGNRFEGDDTVTNYVYVFYGLVEEIIFHPEKRTASLQVSGREKLLQNASAEEASNKVSNEQLKGVADSGSATTNPPNDTTGVLTDNTKSWSADQFNGETLRIKSGVAKGKRYTIDDTTGTTLVCTGDNLYADRCPQRG